MGAVGQIHAVQANVRFPDSVRRAVEGAEAVVNLVGILAKSGRQTFQAVHVAGARAIAEAARAAGAKTLVHVSAIGADKRSKANYARTQGRGRGGRAGADSRTPSSCAPRWCSGRRTSCSIASPPWPATRRSCR